MEAAEATVYSDLSSHRADHPVLRSGRPRQTEIHCGALRLLRRHALRRVRPVRRPGGNPKRGAIRLPRRPVQLFLQDLQFPGHGPALGQPVQTGAEAPAVPTPHHLPDYPRRMAWPPLLRRRRGPQAAGPGGLRPRIHGRGCGLRAAGIRQSGATAHLPRGDRRVRPPVLRPRLRLVS